MLVAVICILAGYLSGSMLYAYWIPKRFRHTDITKESKDGNPGAANAMMQVGVPLGILILLLEILKGYFPVYVGLPFIKSNNLYAGILMAAPVFGHAFSIFRHRKGGKAIAVSFGVLLGLWPDYNPVLLLICFYVFFSLVVRIRPHSWRTAVSFAFLAASSLVLFTAVWMKLGCCLIASIVVWKHRHDLLEDHFQVSLFYRRESKEEETGADYRPHSQ